MRSKLLGNERGIIRDFMLVVIVVTLVCVLWIVFNEAVWQLSDMAITQTENLHIDNSDFPDPASSAKAVIDFAVLIWRVLPVAIIIGVWAWGLMRAFKYEPYTQYPRGY